MMNTYDIWSKICSHQVTGLMYHFQFADMFYFLGFDKLGKDQERHYWEESDSLRKNHCFVLKHHCKVIVTNRAESVEVIPSSWSKYVMSDVDKNTRRSHVVSLFDSWATWETKTKEFYTEMYYELKNQHAIADACRVKEMILAVDDELAHVHKCINILKMHDYSLEAITSL